VYARRAAGLEKSGAKSKTLPDYLLQAEAEAVIAAAHKLQPSGGFIGMALMLQWRAGLRISEAVSLRWQDVDLQLRQLKVVQGKGGKDRVVPLQPELWIQLQAISKFVNPRDRMVPLSATRVSQCLAIAVSDSAWSMPSLGAKRITTHTFRRSAAIHWLSNGVPLNQVQRWLGHESIQTTQIYLDLVADLPGMMDRVP
jgi:integrase